MMNSALNKINVAWLWVITTLSTSLGSLLNIIPEDLGKLGVLLTCVVSMILIRVQIMNLRNARAEYKIKEYQLKALEDAAKDNDSD